MILNKTETTCNPQKTFLMLLKGDRTTVAPVAPAFRVLFCEDNRVPSNAHILTTFFQKTVFFSKICFGNPPSKFFEVCLNSEYMQK
jgi:hypothetical protein